MRGELHRLTLGPAQLVYLGSLQRASPEPDALRFEATELAAY